MRASLLIPFAMIAFALASAATSLSDSILSYAHRQPYITGVPDTASLRVLGVVPQGEPLGFITDVEGRDAGDRRLYVSTYGLAPLILENTANRRFVIGDFRHRSNMAAALRQHRLGIVEDLGNGFLLLAAR